MALGETDDWVELPDEVYARAPVQPVAQPDGGADDWGEPPPQVPYAGMPSGWQPPQSNPTLNPAQKTFLNTTATGRVLNAFGQGLVGTFEGEWGFPETMKQFREGGLFFDPKQKMTDPLGITFQLFAESIIAPAAKGLDAALRVGLSPLLGAAQSIGQASDEFGIAASLGNRGGANEVMDDVIGAVDTLGLMLGMHLPLAPGALMTRRERIAGRERLMRDQIPTREPKKPAQPPAVQPASLPEPDVIPRPPGGATAYHGSAYAFEEFRNESIGSGEGAQTFGFGHYFASNRDVAEFYRDKIGGQEVRVTFNGETFDAATHPDYATRIAAEKIGENKSINSAIASAVEDWRRNIERGSREVAAEYDRAADIMERWRTAGAKIEKISKGELHEVTLKPSPDEYLDWDKNMSEQSGIVQDAYRAFGIVGAVTGEDAYRKLSVARGSKRAASELLLSKGVKGIRYLDQGSRESGKGTSNYVIFDPSDIVKRRAPETPGPSLQIGEQRVVFPDDNHSALFEYGEALTFGDDLPAARAGLIQQFGQEGAATIDAAAKAYYDRVAAKIESSAGEIQAGRADEPGPATFKVTPGKIAQEHDDEIMRLETEAQQLAVRPKGYGDSNRLVSTSQADEARALLNASVQRLTSGADPEAMLAGVKLALYHIEAGTREFAAFSKQMISDLGEWARPYLQDWYDRATKAVTEFIESEAGGGPSRLPRSTRMRPPPQEPHANRAGNINLDRINAPDDVLNLIRETAELNAGFPDARRGRMTFEDIRNLAAAAGMDARVLSKNGVGVAFNAEEAVRLRDLLVTSATHVQELSRKVIGASDEDLLKFQQALTRHVAIQEQVSGITAEAGRALASFNIKSEATDKAKMLADLLERHGGRSTLEEKADAIRRLNDPDQISRAIRKFEKATTMDMVVEAWMNGLLSGPLTHATNVVSNTLTNLANIAETGVAAGIGAAREAAGLGGRERIFAGEASERLFAMVQGAQEGLVAARQAFADDAAASMATGKLDVRRPGAIPSVTVNVPGLGPRQVGGATVRIPSRLLSAEDALFQTMAKRQETSALAFRMASQKGLTGERFAQRVAELVADPTKEMLEQIGKTQTYLTFTKPLGTTGRKIQSALNDRPAFKFLVPFLRTPTNIIKYAGERSVLSTFSKEVRANLSGRNGQVAQDTQLARLILGSAITVSTLYWASSGMVTGGGPTDPRARALLYATGWQPYSIRIGDTYYSYLRVLGPYGILLGAAADASEIADRVDKADAAEVGKLMFASATTNLLNQTWLQGPSDLAQALNDPERYGAPYIQGLTSTLVPSFVAQEARAQDPYLREARGIVDGLKSRIPGMSQTLLPRRDIWGEPIRREGGLGPDRLSPVYLTAIKSDFISREMLRLGVWKAQPARSIRGVELTGDQYDRFQQISGRLTRQALSAVVGRPGWDQMPSYAQANVINRIFDRARESARGQMMISDQELLTKIIQTGVSEVVSEPEGAGLIRYPSMPAGAP
jgi:hypothetical protein